MTESWTPGARHAMTCWYIWRWPWRKCWPAVELHLVSTLNPGCVQYRRHGFQTQAPLSACRSCTWSPSARSTPHSRRGSAVSSKASSDQAAQDVAWAGMFGPCGAKGTRTHAEKWRSPFGFASRPSRSGGCATAKVRDCRGLGYAVHHSFARGRVGLGSPARLLQAKDATCVVCACDGPHPAALRNEPLVSSGGSAPR
jgi:hypothetical protein